MGGSCEYQITCYFGEVKVILKGFSKDKSHEPNDWTAEFFQTFSEIVGVDLVAAVEYSRLEGFVSKDHNATFFGTYSKVRETYYLFLFSPDLLLQSYL